MNEKAGERMKVFLAIDIGASSGRHIAGWNEDGQLQTREVYRFPNGVSQHDGHLTWDLDALVHHVREGIDLALRTYDEIAGLSIDTWGVDYILMHDDQEILPAYAYRDSRTEIIIPKVHEKVPFDELYHHTGTQFQPFNTIYQLCADLESGRLNEATDLLMMPEYLMYKLCGTRAREYTNASTTGLLSAKDGTYDMELIRRLGLPERLFPALQQPGTCIGSYRGIPIRLCATHDTASAVEGIPMEGNQPYISSGTWSLLGVKTPAPITTDASQKGNWSNEGGVGYNRYQKNIMGMWLVNRLRDELCPGRDFSEIVHDAEHSSFDAVTDVNTDAFLAPESMSRTLAQALPVAPESPADYFRCAYRSLALCYAQSIRELEANTGCSYTSLYIVGGGAKNAFLNRLTEEASGKHVIALPIEATALGNLRIQMKAADA